MVRKGEYLERAVVIPSGSLTLEGLYHRGDGTPGVLLVPPHPYIRGSMEISIIAELAWAVTRAGHPTLRFNYQGVGASRGEFSEAEALTGARAARSHLLACMGEESPIGALGLGFGASVAASLALETKPLISPLIMVCPDPAQLPDGLNQYRGELLVVVPQYAPGDAEALMRLCESVPNGRYAAIPRADGAFVRGLVELGKVVADVFSPPGMIELS